MINNVNPFQLIQMIKSGNNPQQLLSSVLQNSNNPILNNAMNLAKGGNASALQQIARNLAQQRGINFDQQFANFKNNFK